MADFLLKCDVDMKDNDSQLNLILDQMTDSLMSGHEIEYSELVLDWFRNSYRCSSVPRPDDNDPLRLAVKASIVERMVEVFNSPPHNDDQAVPAWCETIGAVDELVKLQSERLLEGEDYCEVFEKRNLLVVKNFMYFI